MIVLSITMFLSACQANRHTQTAAVQTQASPDYKIHVDRANNGAAKAIADNDAADAADQQRTLAFEMVGYSTTAQDATAEQRVAASQAAVIDAFCKALIEARTARGESSADFTTKIGPRLMVAHRTIDGGYEVQISLMYRGIESLFVVRNGVLQHPPQDLGLIRRLFEETNGEFSLLTMDASDSGSVALAKVGCYRPAGFDARLSGDVTGQKVETP
jgi:hypothetical protein